jgi:penicillin amidase
LRLGRAGRAAVWLLGAPLGAVAAAMPVALVLLWASLPTLEGRVVAPGVAAPVEILRDRWGVPHIRAGSAADAYFALGYVHAQDRLWQMELRRRIAQGRLSEVLGRSALPVDRLLRTLGLYRGAQAAAASLTGDARLYLDAYAAGVNAYLAGRRWTLPPEFLLLWHRPEPWTVADSLVLTRLMALDLAENWRRELLRARLARVVSPEQLRDLFPPPPDAPATIAQDPGLWRGRDLERLAAALPEPPPPGLGSNIWAVSGARSASGRPLLANDPHLQLDLPGAWYLASLEAPGLAVAGGTMPAMPAVVIGHNGSLAWGLTNTGADVQDLFLETVDPADAGRYLTPSGSRPFTVRTETIQVRFGAPETLTVRETRHGPVVSDLGDPTGLADGRHVLALAWTAFDEGDVTLTAGFALATARSPTDVDHALEAFGGPVQNLVYATTMGEIGLRLAGELPIRRSGDGRMPVPGATGQHDWVGRLPAAARPRLVDPADGQIVNANNRLVAPGRMDAVVGEWEPALRARRIEALLGDRAGLTAAEFRAMQADRHSTLAEDMLPHLLRAARGPAPDLLRAMAAWDRVMAADRPEPLAFATWYDELAVALYADELGPLFAAYRGQRPDFVRLALEERTIWCDDIATPEIETCEGRIALAWERAIERVSARHGADWRRWRWDAAHHVEMRHEPLARIPVLGRLFRLVVPRGGDGSSLDVAHFRPEPDGAFVTRAGPSYRMVVDLGAPEEAMFVAATGQSGHPLSRHWRDLTDLWAADRYVPMRPAAEAIRHRLVLDPAELGQP